MNRRAFVTGLGAVLAAPLVARAQQTKVPRIGVLLTLYPVADDPPQELKHGLRALGYTEGQNIVVEWRSAEGRYERLPALVAELVQLKVDVLVVDVTRAAQAARQATSTTPIVIMVAADPVGNGLVSSLAHPGGNITGLSIMLSDISAKRLQLFAEAVPAIRHVAVLWNPASPYHKTLLNEVDAAAPALHLRLLPIAVQAPSELEGAFSSMAKAHVNALLVADDPMFLTARTRLIELATKDRLPTMFAHRDFVPAGGLMSYGPNLSERFRLAATYVDKILNGAKPANLPVDQAVKLEFVVNLKTAKALRLTIPPSLLLRADQVIE